MRYIIDIKHVAGDTAHKYKKVTKAGEHIAQFM